MKTTTSSKSKHGGKRKGAGKPAQFENPMKRINVMLDPETIAFYKTQGKNLSEGIRNHWRGITPLALDEGYSADLPGDSTPEDLSGLGAGSTPALRQ